MRKRSGVHLNSPEAIKKFLAKISPVRTKKLLLGYHFVYGVLQVSQRTGCPELVKFPRAYYFTKEMPNGTLYRLAEWNGTECKPSRRNAFLVPAELKENIKRRKP